MRFFILKDKTKSWLYDIIFVFILIAALFLRLNGSDWDEVENPHPDERFLSLVTSAISPVSSIREYFDTDNSSLNPNNRGYDFYVYGTVPIFITRYVSEWTNLIGYGNTFTVGRHISAVADFLVVFLVYLIARRLFDEKTALFAGVFSAFTVLEIQLSHFYVVDPFTNLFVVLTIYISVLISTQSKEKIYDEHGNFFEKYKLNWVLVVLFGVAFGLAMASKLSAFPVAFLLPLALIVYLWDMPRQEKTESFWRIFIYLVLGAIFSLITFRIAQPYAFNGPSFFNWGINPKWWSAISSQQSQAAGAIDWPPSIQWARRSKLFSFLNLSIWGIGIPMALVAWGGVVYSAVKMVKSRFDQNSRKFILLWVWTVAYFLWQSMAFNPTMRYQLNVYAPLAIFAGWMVVCLFDIGLKNKKIVGKIIVVMGKCVAVIAVVGTVVYGVAFSNIYSQEETRHEASKWIYQNVPGPITLPLQMEDGEIYNQQIGISSNYIFNNGVPYSTSFLANQTGVLKEIHFYKFDTVKLFDDYQENKDVYVISVKVGDNPVSILIPEIESGKTDYVLELDEPVLIQKNMLYSIEIVVNTNEALRISGASPINETNWDMALPFRVENYDPFVGLYRSDLNLDIYADGDEVKRERFISMLNDGDFLFISSSRQWGSLPRIPERYPMAEAYYSALMGCPDSISVEKCYNSVELGMYEGRLGFDLVYVAENSPHIGDFKINDQSSEEAFTVYDHPKVFVFKKSENYDEQVVADFFNSIDISQMHHVTPKEATESGLSPEQARNQPDLMLTDEQLENQRNSGTWSELFNSNSIINKNEIVGVLVWYLVLWVLSISIFPILRYLFSSLPDKGYPISRIAGMALLAFFAWLFANLGFSYSRIEIIIVWAVLFLISVFLVIKQKDEIKIELRLYWKYYFLVEVLFVIVFIFGLLIRFGNPDLWHISKGGEKPMDFAYFNAILKSSTFPPYDPWFAGGYLNYYYFGFVLVGTLVKLIGIVPSFAYNLILPTLLAILVLGGFSISWNIYLLNDRRKKNERPISPWFVGLLGGSFLAIIGNMGMIQMLLVGFAKLGASYANLVFDSGAFFQKIWWGIKGFFLTLSGHTLPYYLSDYYWWPGRVIRAIGETEPITEFPFFTFVYADPHAHYFSLPLATLILSISLSIVFFFKKQKNSLFNYFLNLIFAGIVVAMIYMTNTWDYPVYLAISCLAIFLGIYKFFSTNLFKKEFKWQEWIEKSLVSCVGLVILYFTFKVATYFYDFWNVSAYSSIKIWTGQTTSISNYLTHWLLFISILFIWLVWETKEWLMNTPASYFLILKENLWAVIGIPVLTLLAILSLCLVGGVKIAVIVVPLGVWIILLLFRKNITVCKQLVLFLAGAALFLTLMVEVVVLDGDIARMNTVFKFYLQAWTLFSIAVAVALGWILSNSFSWKIKWQKIVYSALVFLVFLSFLFPVIGVSAKVKDRMAIEAPHTLDGMSYMEFASYFDQSQQINFDEDYRLIKWMQENIEGTPIIVEAHIHEYYWGGRISIYTGLPTVLGWNWHQRQQRGVLQDAEVWQRAADIENFYNSLDVSFIKSFIEEYNIEYIVVGQLERAFYDANGIDKFDLWIGNSWEVVYEDGLTTLYQVVQ